MAQKRLITPALWAQLEFDPQQGRIFLSSTTFTQVWGLPNLLSN
jgi:hypothetical protein